VDPPSPTAPRPRVWTVFVAYTAFMVSYLAMGAGLAIVFLVRSGIDLSNQDQLDRVIESLARSFPVLAGSFAGTMALLLLYTLLGARLSPAPWRARLSWGPWRGGWRLLGLALVAGLALSITEGTLVAMLWPRHDWSWSKVALSLSALSGPQFALIATLIGVVGPVAEELFFRGYMQTRLRQRYGRWPAILVTAALFGVYHLDPTHIVTAALLGVLIGWVADASGSIVPAVGMHIFNNVVAVLSSRASPDEQRGVTPGTVAVTAAAGLVFVACVVLARRRLDRGREAPLPA
jgi:membrane protease YdiL (CAAX protease family)